MTLQLQQGSGGEKVASGLDANNEKAPQLKIVDGTADSTKIIASGNGTETAALRITLASDSDGKIKATTGANLIGEVTIGASSGLGKKADSPHASGDIGLLGLAVRQDTPADLSGTDGDYEPLTVSGGYLQTYAQGDKAHDSAITEFDRPVLLATESVETDGSAASQTAEGDAMRLKSCLNGLLLAHGI